jgi:hypothetical protein
MRLARLVSSLNEMSCSAVEQPFAAARDSIGKLGRIGFRPIGHEIGMFDYD